MKLFHFYPQTKSKLGERTAQIEVWSARHNQATQFLISCLEDVKDKIVTLERPRDGGYPSPNPSPFGAIARDLPPPLSDVAVLPGRLEDLSAEQRERVLSHLLERLRAFTKSQQLEAVTALDSPPPQLQQQPARRSMGNDINLPRITAHPRRNTNATLPISQV